MVLLSVSVLLSCASYYMVKSPGPLSGLKLRTTCVDHYSLQKRDCLLDLDNDVFLMACIWLGVSGKFMGLVSMVVVKSFPLLCVHVCKSQEDEESCACHCQHLSSILTLFSVLCYLFEFLDIVAHLSALDTWEYHGDYKPVCNKVILGFLAFRQARAPVAGFELSTDGSL
ncbi:hypothetical protein PoB_004513400 [Plakobranchus ocellatus]|uniref:Uncharacterized protein n=1 Tax=Plakobranchus ocellatus TaxID=259542 RepID=A0AAV4BJZ3_9GAST|nr:hypothetical protein PoB_004513400 [Plakobranchus ocellatus]